MNRARASSAAGAGVAGAVAVGKGSAVAVAVGAAAVDGSRVCGAVDEQAANSGRATSITRSMRRRTGMDGDTFPLFPRALGAQCGATR